MITKDLDRIKEYYQHEEKARVKFYDKNKDLLQKHAKTLKPNKYNKLEQEYHQLMTQCSQHFDKPLLEPVQNVCSSSYNADLLKKTKNPRGISDTVRKVSHKHLHILFTDDNNQGRKLYLKERSKIPPEDRYWFKKTTAFTYGWKLPKNVEMPEHGRLYALRNYAWRENGLAMFQKENQYSREKPFPNLCYPCL